MTQAQTRPTRQPKKLDLTEAVSRFVPDEVESLAIGGMHMHNNPMALIRELVRQKKRIKRLITSPAACINADLLIGAGLVGEIVTAYVGFEHLGLAPSFRRFAQEAKLKVYELDELSLILGLRAAASGLPFAALPPGLELSDVTQASPEFYATTTDPFTGRMVLAVPPIKPQIAFVAVQQADQFGNGVFKGGTFTDREMVLAADTVILQAEQMSSPQQLMKTPMQVTVPSMLVTAVVEANFGCHPTSCHRIYHYDEWHLKEYLRLAATDAGFQEYMETYINGKTEAEYLVRTQTSQH
jgi:glutaconate CoA-transferase subunit A